MDGAVTTGDVDGDGTLDVIIGAYELNTTEGGAGGAYVVSGDEVWDGVDVLLATATLSGTEYGEALGRSVTCLGDQDGDGYADFAVGATSDDAGMENAGATWLYYGPVAGALTREDADAAWFGPEHYAAVGMALAGDEDVDADGYDDLVIGASGIGVVYVVPGLAP